jgi:hypothetical protein
VNIAAILSGKAPASKRIVGVIIILFGRIVQYDGGSESNPVCLKALVEKGYMQWMLD